MIQTRLNHIGTGKGKKNKVKKYEKDNPCEDPKPTNKRHKITEAESIHTVGHGGKIQGDIAPAPSLRDIHIDAEGRASNPGDITKTPFSYDATYDAYVAIFMKCGDAAKLTISADVLE